MYAWTLSFTAVVRNSAPLPCIGASHLRSATKLRCLAPLLRYQACVGATRVQHLCLRPVSHARVREVEPPTAFRRNGPVYHGCPARTHWSVSRVRLIKAPTRAVLVGV